MRARVRVGAEVHDVALGGATTLSDGRALSVELLPTRAFRIPGAFRFEYPREWNFIGAVGVPEAIDAWWTLHGEGAAIYLRRHGQAAADILDEYAANLSASQGSVPYAVRIRLDGRELEGRACTYDVGSVGPGPTLRWEQQVYAWTGNDGAAWLLTLQRSLGPTSGWEQVSPIVQVLEGIELELIPPAGDAGIAPGASGEAAAEGATAEGAADPGRTGGEAPSSEAPWPAGAHPALDAWLASFRWESGG